MRPTLRYRLFGIGKMPADLRQAILAEPCLVFEEGIHVVLRRDGRLPGVFRQKSVMSLSGAIALTKTRIVGTAGKRKLLDTPFGASPNGAAALRFGVDGLHMEVDIGVVLSQGRGTIRLHFQRPLSQVELHQLPTTELRFEARPEAVEMLFRWRGV